MSPSDKPFDEERYKALMDGHAIKEKSIQEVLGNKDYRIDSQFWTTSICKNDNLRYSKIGELILESQYGISVDMNTDKRGYPIFRMNELHDMLMDLSVEKYADISPKEYQVFSLNDGDVLFNRTNSYEWVGRTAVYYKNNNTPFTYASYLVKFVTDRARLLPECLTAFLSCKYGVTAIKARARQSINQTNVNPEEVKEIEMPLFSRAFQESLRDLFVRANANRAEADIVYNQANTILNKSINCVNASSAAISVKPLSNSFLQSGRLDAEYYQPKYDVLNDLLKIKHKKLVELAYVDAGEFVEETKYGEIGVPYVRGSNITNSVIDICNSTKVNVNINQYNHICKNDLAFAMIGSVGNVAINLDDECIVSNNLGALRPFDKNMSYYLLVYLNSRIGQLFFEKYQTRTAQPKIRREDVENFIVPLIDDNDIKEISEAVSQSFDLRRETKRLLDLAVKAVEIAIETDENIAMNWLQAQI